MFDIVFKQMTNEYEPCYTWLWNTKITRYGIKKRIDEMHETGIKSFYVLGEPKNFRPQKRKTFLEPDYLSDEYIELLRYAIGYAKKKGMRCWLYNEGGFPSGMAAGKIVSTDPSLRKKGISVRETNVSKGEKYKPHERLISAFFENSRIKEDFVFPRDGAVCEYTACEKREISAWCDEKQADIADEKTTALFLKVTHERLLKGLGDENMRRCLYMFDDESNMGGWSEGFEVLFMNKYGYDIAGFMPYICGKKKKGNENDKKAKADYEMLCGELQNVNYFLKMKQWLNKHGMKSVGHLDKDNETDGFMQLHYGNSLKILRSFDVPGIDVIWGQITYPKDEKCCFEGYEFFPLIASSASRQNGSNEALSETFAVYGSQLNAEEMRFVINYQAVRGINIFNFMTMSYEKKGILPFQYRPSFIPENPGCECLSEINGYTARLSYLMRSGNAVIDTALYYPFRTICAGGEEAEKAKESFEKKGLMLERAGICFDLVDEEYLKSHKKPVKYKNIYVPFAPLETDETKALLSKYKACAEPLIKCESFVRCRAVENGGERLYFVTNESGVRKKTEIVLPENRNVYEINLRDGKIYGVKCKAADNGVKITIDAYRGEGKMFLCTDRSIDAVNVKTEEPVTLICGSAHILRRYTVENGAVNKKVNEKTVLGYAPKDFSGEIKYSLKLPGEIEEGEYYIELDEPRYFVKAYQNGGKIAEVTMPPYIIKTFLKPGDELDFLVSNTAANACAATDFFDNIPPDKLGSYSADMIKRERKALCGGFGGRVMLYKII